MSGEDLQRQTSINIQEKANLIDKLGVVNIDIDYLKTVNYALFHNRIPVCQFVNVTNISKQPLNDIKVCCKGVFVRKYESNLIGRINTEETVRIMPFEISPDASKLSVLTERVVTNFTLTVTSQDEIIEEKLYEIELMPYDHWLGTTIMPQTLVSFVTPNHPVINSLVVKAAAALKQVSGSSLLTAYQTGNSNDVRL